MKPYYEQDGITIYHGDCREILPSLERVDAVITDPVWPNCPPGMLPGSEDPTGLFSQAAPLLVRVGRTVVIILGTTSDPRFLTAMPPDCPFVAIRYLRYALPSYRGRLIYGGDVAYVFGEVPKPPDGKRCLPGEITHVHKGDPWHNGTGHPAARQLSHMNGLVHWYGGQAVVDPFMGSGTTLRAAKDLGRRAIGIEVEEKYCEIAVKRLAQGVLF